MDLLLERIASPLGDVLLVTDETQAVRALDFHDYEARMHRLLHTHYGVYRLRETTCAGSVSAALMRYFNGDTQTLRTLRVETNGTAFQRKVWTALREIPTGQVMTYGQLAARLGMSNAARAVGLANASNPVAVIVPCHRVVGASGALTGFAGGLPRKAWLLRHEGVLTKENAQHA